MDRNQHVLAIAFKKAKGKRGAIARLGITPEMAPDAKKKLVISLAEAKAKDTSTKVDEHLDGQQWYVESLIEFSGLTAKEQLDAEYDAAFPSVAGEDELLAALEAS